MRQNNPIKIRAIDSSDRPANDETAPNFPAIKAVMDGREIKRLFDLPPVAASFPVRFSTGARIKTIDGECSCCTQSIDPQWLRGEVVPVMTDVYRFSAVGYCPRCRVLQPFEYRLHRRDTGICISGFRSGAWRTWAMTQDAQGWRSWLYRIRAQCKRLGAAILR